MTTMTRRRLLAGGTTLAAFLPFAKACAPATVMAAGAGSADLDGIAMAQMIARGETTSLQLTEAAIARAEAVNPSINAFATKTYDLARSRAAASPKGSFGGVPTAIKDLVNWKGAPTMYGSRAFRGNLAEEDSVFAAKWREAGVVSIGKSTTPEMGLISSTEPLVTGPTRNPWDPSRIPGGSSGGAAALTAARIVPFAHASDGGGSIRIPAACCGLFGLKPSRGALAAPPSSAPVDLSVNHAVTLTVRDSAALFAAAETGESQPKIGEITGPSSRRLKIALTTDPGTDAALDPEVRAATEQAAELCRELGHEVIEWDLPVDARKFQDQFILFWAAGAAEFMQDAAAALGTPPSPETIEPWTLGLAALFSERRGEFAEAVADLQAFSSVYASWFDEFDVLLTPTVTKLPPKIGEQAPDGDFDTVMKSVTDYVAYTPYMNVSGAASMSVPLFWSEGGLPIGSMFSGRQGDDGLLLALAYELEQARPWISRRPQLIAT
ncbi:amidase [Thalassovita mediterranea]|nr:amidase [Thalassovita mediterranea]